MLNATSAVSGAGLHCRDLLNNEELFLMDVGFSRGGAQPGLALATRTIPMGDYWITTGAALPINSDAARRMKIATPKWREHQRGLALSMVRACLAAGAAERVTYLTPANPSNQVKEPSKRWWRRFGSLRHRRRPTGLGSTEPTQ